MEKRTPIYAAAILTLAIAGAACSSVRGDEDRDGRATGSGDTVTIAGCLTSGPDGRFALTAAPDAAVATAARAMADERTTHSYVLVGGENLQAHVGKRVEVTGALTGNGDDIDEDTTRTTEAPRSGGGDTPTVKTKEEIELEVRQLKVNQIRDVAPTCELKP